MLQWDVDVMHMNFVASTWYVLVKAFKNYNKNNSVQ